jgi:outer membrane protein assembly factor BamB
MMPITNQTRLPGTGVPGYGARAIIATICLAAAIYPQISAAEEWPTYMHDNARSGGTSETLDLSALRQVWVYTSPCPPRTAFAGAAPWDAIHDVGHRAVMTDMRDFDSALFVSVIGDSVYLGSSVTDSIHCLAIHSGEQKWAYTTDGPVRFPPSYDNGRLYFASDDGYAYCVDAGDGSFVWKYTPIPPADRRLISNNGKLIPMWPIRTGTVVAGGHVYFAASLVPWRESYLCSVNATDGTENYRVSGGSTPMGAILTSSTKIYLTQGRTFPSVYDRANGSLNRNLESSGYGGGLTNAGNANGGVYALITSDSTPQFVYGRGQSYGADSHPTEGSRLRAFNASTADSIATHAAAICMVVSDGTAYILTGTSLHAIARPAGPTVWTTGAGFDYSPSTLIQAGSHLFVGGNGKVVAYDGSNGNELWSKLVTGRVRGLAAANGHLFVSTETGHIYAFGGVP